MTVLDAIASIRGWGEERDWKGYDPYDALNSRVARLLSLDTALGRRLLLQTVKLSPLNLRPLLGVRPEWNSKALGLIASAYARLHAVTGDEDVAATAERWLEWLGENRASGGSGWGYHFAVQTRFFSYPRGMPNTIATSFVAQAFLDGRAHLPHGERHGFVAEEAARYLVDHMLVEGPSGPYFRYLPSEDTLIHNANLLACAVLARISLLTGSDEFTDVAIRAARTSVAAQRDDGSWGYAEGSVGGWVDNFHTGYVLESLAGCVGVDRSLFPALERGVAFWDRELFLTDGSPRYFATKTFPLDSHNYAQAVETWLAVMPWLPQSLTRARRSAQLLIERMLAPTGYVYFQRRRFWVSRVPLIRWSTAPSFRALAGLALAEHLLHMPSYEVGSAHLD